MRLRGLSGAHEHRCLYLAHAFGVTCASVYQIVKRIMDSPTHSAEEKPHKAKGKTLLGLQKVREAWFAPLQVYKPSEEIKQNNLAPLSGHTRK